MGIDEALSGIDKAFGAGTVRRGSDDDFVPTDWVSTGSIALDRALGGRGFPLGAHVMVYGPYSSGKTTVALHAVANAQMAGRLCAFIDAEFAYNPDRAKLLGVNTDDLLVCQPDTAENGLEIAERLIRSGDVSVLVIDSVAALTPRAEVEGDMGDSHVGRQARLLGQACRKLTAPAAQNNCLVIWINQVRQGIGPYAGEVVSGGKALGFYCWQIVDVRRIETLKSGDNPVGNRTKAKIKKNKVGPPEQVAEFDILYSCGISREAELIELGAKKSGSWFSFDDIKLGQGKENARLFLLDNPDVADKIEQSITNQEDGK